MPQARITFFGNDWRSDSRLRLCSAASRGVWIDLMTFMMEAEPFGSLLINGMRPTAEQIAALTVTPVKVVRVAMTELENNGVYSKDADGTVFSRRMRRDAERAAEARANGRTGGNPRLKPQHNDEDKPGVNPPHNLEGLPQGDKPHARGPSPIPSPMPMKTDPNGSDSGEGAAEFAFSGRIIRLSSSDLEKWRNAYKAIPDIEAELTTLDAFYDQELRGKDRKNWFIRCSSALGKRHQERIAESRRPAASPMAGRAAI
jgi:hypothetical protein